MIPLVCPHCGETIRVEVKAPKVTTRTVQQRYVPTPRPVNAIAGPPTIPPRGIR